MRKLVASVNITLDGFMAGPACELDWHFSRWTQEMAEVQTRQLSLADDILLGRITYNAMAAYWPATKTDISFPRGDLAFAELMNSRKKIVFSRGEVELNWENSVRSTGGLQREVYELKKAAGNDIIVYGSGKLLSSLIKLGLIDQYTLWVHPVLLGKGKPLFGKGNELTNMRLSEVQQFSSGVVLLQYETFG